MQLLRPADLDADERARLPTEDDLPCSDGVPMETPRHRQQMNLLIETIELHWADRQDFYVGGDMFLYFSLEQVRGRDFRGPDFFAVLDVSREERKSWVVWQEGKGPDIIIELLSESTALVDKVEKKQVYQDVLQVGEYVWYDPFSAELAGFSLEGGLYEPLVPDGSGRLHSRRLGLALVRWYGAYRSVLGTWLRWATPDGVLLPTDAERNAEDRRRADSAERRIIELGARLLDAERRAEQVDRFAARIASLEARFGVSKDQG